MKKWKKKKEKERKRKKRKKKKEKNEKIKKDCFIGCIVAKKPRCRVKSFLM
jgi:hypothetical protein